MVIRKGIQSKSLICFASLSLSILFLIGNCKKETGPISSICAEVLVLTKSGVIKMPEGKIEAPLNEIKAPRRVMNCFRTIRVQKIRKAMPDFNPADTIKITPDGDTARLPDFSNLFVLQLSPDFDRDLAVTLLENLPEVIYAEKNQKAEPLSK